MFDQTHPKPSPLPPPKPCCHFFQTISTEFFDPLHPISEVCVCFGVEPSVKCGQPKRGYMTKMFISFSSLSLFFINLQCPCWLFSFILIFHQYCWFSLCFSDVSFCVLNFPPGPWLSSTSLRPLSRHWSLLPINFWDPHVIFYLFQSFVELRS